MPKFDVCWCNCYNQRDAVCLTACFTDWFIHWILELTGLFYFLYTIKFVYKICIKFLSVIKLQWWWWSVNIMKHITIGIAPIGQTQKWELTDRQQPIHQPLFPNQCDDNAIQNKWCRGYEINDQQNQKYAAWKSQEALWPFRTKQTPIWNIHTSEFSSMRLEWHL